jgi:hypothetical protein
MNSIGTLGGYSVPQNSLGGLLTVDYPLGPSQWTAALSWPLRKSSRVYAADLNRQLSQAVAFLSRKPMFQGVQYTAQSIATSTTVPVTLDTEITDPWTMHQISSDTSQVIVPQAADGIWLVQGTVPFAASGVGHYYSSQIQYTPNGGSPTVISGERIQSNGTRVEPDCADLISANAGDTFQICGFHTTGTSVNTWVSTSSTPAVAYNDFASPLMTARWVASSSNVPGGVIHVAVPAGWVNDFTAIAQTVNLTLTAPNPGTWTSLQEATGAQFNSDIRNSVLFLSHVPACRTWANGTIGSIASGGSGSAVTGMQATIDNWSAFNPATNTWTAPISGSYLLYGQVGFPTQASAFTASAYLFCTISGSTFTYNGANAFSATPAGTVMKQLRRTAGDKVQLFGFQNFGSALTPSSQTNTRFFALWQSA